MALCPQRRKAALICISSNCKSPHAVACDREECGSCRLHGKCASMRWAAVCEKVGNWRGELAGGAAEFVRRVEKVFANVRVKLEKEEQLFEEYCVETLLGRDFGKAGKMIEKGETNQLTPQLMASALSQLPTINEQNFSAFSLSDMRNLDDKILSLFDSLQTLYKSKHQPPSPRIQRSNSAQLPSKDSQPKQMTQSLLQPHNTSQTRKQSMGEVLALKTDLTFPKSISSRIITEATALNRILGRKVKKYQLAYRATESGFSIAEFYRKMGLAYRELDNRSLMSGDKEWITVILVKTEFGRVIGGLTKLRWECNSDHREADSDDQTYNPQQKDARFHSDPLGISSMFYLDKNERYELLKPGEAIYCGRKSIGFGRKDIRIRESPKGERRSYCKFPGSYNYSRSPYQAIGKTGMEMVGSRYSQMFKVEEWEAHTALL